MSGGGLVLMMVVALIVAIAFVVYDWWREGGPK